MIATRPPTRSTAMHEAHHSAALLLLGLPPKQARCDWPGEHTLGEVELDWGDGVDHHKARKVLQAVLAGGLCNGCEGWDEFPLDPDGVPAGSRHDAVQARRLGDFLQLDQSGGRTPCGRRTGSVAAPSSAASRSRSHANWRTASCSTNTT